MRDEEEAQIVAEAGEVGAVTISTNMAGRGTDIQLGGRQGERHVEVKELGGLSVLGTNRHESRRIDTQLRGRAGRQGDPGSSRFFLSLEDDLFVRYGLDKRIPLRSSMMEQKETVNRRLLQRTIDHAQRVVEGQNLDLRGALWRFSRIVEAQRRIMSQRRKEVLKEATSLSIPLTIATHQWNEVEALIGLPNLQKVLRRLTLLSIDECWSDHIERITDIQESIHLTQIGGMDPLIEFQKRASASFEQAQSEINDRMAERFMSLSFTSEDVDLEEMGLRGPSSTWTYLISDLTYTDQLAAMLISTRHIGFAVNAAMLTPLIVAADLLSRFRRGLLSSENDQS
jgi:preprotein translocase subunit SecA